ncbi:MAG: hypothetical protein IJP26_03840 [Clostridia bacterium]|nr:hypothetical protein [Clostridia bacterium]
MKLFEKLENELKNVPNGTYAPYFYRVKGFRRNLAANPSELRANGINALFTETTPIILKNEVITGNRFSLYTNASALELEYYKNLENSFGKRDFIHNRDHYAPNFDHTMEVGVTGLIEEIKASLEKHKDEPQKVETLNGMLIVMEGFLKMIENYAEEAKKLRGNPEYNQEYIEFIIENCTALTKGKPETFAQGLQLMWFCHLAFLMEGRYAMALGRVDQFLYPLYKKDKEAGIITDEQVIEMFENIFVRICDCQDIVNICIGGQNMNGECQVNDLTYCIIRAVKGANVPGPNLSLRLTENTPDDFLDECIQLIGTGIGYPALMNDDVNINALKKCGYEEEDVYNYSMVGCIENFITGMQPPWTDGRFDTPRFFDYVFNNGFSETNKSVGLVTQSIESMTTMQEFIDALKEQIDYGVKEYVGLFNSRNNVINQEYYPQPFLSCFCHDCIGRGLDINNGGSKYPSVHGAAIMGIGTMSDSLSAIEKVVFVDKEATLEELRDALNNNFEGYEELHNKLLEAPKYGNNDNFVDKYAVWLVDYVYELFSKYKTRDGGMIYIAASANIDNIDAGYIINATPDGRKRGAPLSDAASPTYGKDTKGATSTLNSVSKPDYEKVICGSVVNQKFSPAMFTPEKRKKLAALVRAYFKLGGQEVQINSTSREVLLDAMDHPEKYQNLVVRVSGFSAFYVTLSKDVQHDILSRTQQE